MLFEMNLCLIVSLTNKVHTDYHLYFIRLFMLGLVSHHLLSFKHPILERFTVIYCFPGSVYEISGSEVCLCTGDLVKVISFELLSISCEDISNNTMFELPLNHSGRY